MLIRRREGFRNARVKKVIFLGLDGLDPGLTERFMAEGRLPNLRRLKEQGGFRRLRTTFPALSPVAWSTFATGVNPARHNIFDFLNRNTKTYVPELAAAKVHKPARVLHIGRYRIPLSGRRWSCGARASRSGRFWESSESLRRLSGFPSLFRRRSSMGGCSRQCARPTCKGTQGSFSQYTTRLEQATFESGSRYPPQANSAAIWKG